MKQLDEAIFIHRIPYSETSLITTFFTREHGFQRFLFKGGKKKSHQLFPMSVSEVEFYSRKESDLWNLTGAEPVFRQTLSFDPVKSSIAFFMGDVLNMVLRGTERDENLYQFVRDSVQAIESAEDLAMFPGVFLISLSKHLGVQPLIEDDTRHWFDLRSGIIGGVREPDAELIEGEIAKSVVQILRGQTDELHLKKADRQRVLRVMIDYYKTHVPGFKEPGTYDIIREILY